MNLKEIEKMENEIIKKKKANKKTKNRVDNMYCFDFVPNNEFEKKICISAIKRLTPYDNFNDYPLNDMSSRAKADKYIYISFQAGKMEH